jgi:hypothetical protein
MGRIALSVAVLLCACTNRPIDKVPGAEFIEERNYYALSLDTDVDILFVIDNSNSMGQEQQNLARNFPKFIDALRTTQLGPDGSGRPCNENDTSGCKIPNVNIGVVSTDLGAGNYGLPSCEVAGGDGGKLLAKPRIAGCTPPSRPFIRYDKGETNIKSATEDPIQRVKEAFSCIAEIGTGGCGFEHTLESARRALDPKLALNPGFIRPEALLAIVFITDEDDCSAQKPQLFDSGQTNLTDPLGPLTSFRCFEFGLQCEVNDRTRTGPRAGCRPAYDWLYKVEDYISFFKGLKPEGRVIVSAISGPTDRVEVGRSGNDPTLMPSCQTANGHAVPALRLKAVVDAFGKRGSFSTICTDDFGPALRGVAERIIANIHSCLGHPPLTAGGSVACSPGAVIGTDGAGRQVTCRQGCIERADCVVYQSVPRVGGASQSSVVPRCPAELFRTAGTPDCGASCPCWRLVPSGRCAKDGRTGYKLEILGKGEPPKGAAAEVACQASTLPWTSPEFAALPQCL